MLLHTDTLKRCVFCLIKAPKLTPSARSMAGPLFYSTCYGHEAASQALIERGADLHIVEATGFPLLHTLAFNDAAEGLRILFENGVDVESEDRIGNTPLLYSVRAKSFDALQLLLEIGANPGAKEKENGSTGLHYAVSNGHILAAQLLISFGAHVDTKGLSGSNPLHLAAINGQEEFVRMLLASGADMKVKDKNGQTALQLAALHNQSAIMSTLIMSDF